MFEQMARFAHSEDGVLGAGRDSESGLVQGMSLLDMQDGDDNLGQQSKLSKDGGLGPEFRPVGEASQSLQSAFSSNGEGSVWTGSTPTSDSTSGMIAPTRRRQPLIQYNAFGPQGQVEMKYKAPTVQSDAVSRASTAAAPRQTRSGWVKPAVSSSDRYDVLALCPANRHLTEQPQNGRQCAALVLP